MKICSKCKEEKLFSEFHRNRSRKDGYDHKCKPCTKEYNALNSERINRNKKQYYIHNREEILAYIKDYNNTNKYKRNVIEARRRALKLKATPNWLTKEELEEIVEFYKKSQELTVETGKVYHVDHIVPLQGKSVCGLHVPWNLQVILASENLTKHNKLIEE